MSEVVQSDTRPFQARLDDWMQTCFGPEISADRTERNHRFIEEALELVQACGGTRSEAHQIVDYVYGRPQGDVNQEVGGAVVTLAALCNAHGLDMNAAAEAELRRVWMNVDKIRAKQAAKPSHSPLAENIPDTAVTRVARALVREGADSTEEFEIAWQQPDVRAKATERACQLVFGDDA